MKTSLFRIITVLVFWALASHSAVGQTPPYLDPTAPVDQRVEDLLGRMTLDEKIGQMMQVDHPAVLSNPSLVTTYFMGSVLSGGGSDIGDNTTAVWAALHDTMQSYALKTRLGIPLIYGIDAVHGNNNIYGATVFPHNVGLGCTRDSALVFEAARVTAAEVAATGIEWTFAPCIAVPRNERWGRTYEGFGETPELAQRLGAAAVRGFQGDSLNAAGSIAACAKHFVGDGGTTDGIDGGDTQCTEEVLRSIHLPGYKAAIDAGAATIMVSFNSWNDTLMSANGYLLTRVLKEELGFKGFLVSDWGALDYLGSDYFKNVATSINAGMDMVMLPYRYVDFQTAMRTLVGNGTIPISRLDDAVRRILRIKFLKGLFEHPFTNKSLQSAVGSTTHRAVARRCVRESLVLLSNDNYLLPLVKVNKRVLVAGSHADNIGYQCGGWTISWQGQGGNITPGTTILQGMRDAAAGDEIVYSQSGDFTNTHADYSVVIIGEQPYAEWAGDRTDLSLAASDIALVTKMKGFGNPLLVILVSGRPLIISGILDVADAILAAWLPGTEGGGVADVLFGDYSPQGKLSHSWPRTMAQIPINVGDAGYDPLYAYGYGLAYLDTGVAYAHDAQLLHISRDTLRVLARVENPRAHSLKVTGIFSNGSGALIDSVVLKDDGLHGDSLAGDGFWGFDYVPKKDDTVRVTLRTDDLTSGTSITLPHAAHIVFAHGVLIALDASPTDFGKISNTLQHRDTTFMVRNLGFTSDSITILLDPVNVIPETAVSVSPTSFLIGPGGSQEVTFSIQPKQLVPQYYYSMITVQPKSGLAQGSLSKNFSFQIVIAGAVSPSAEIPKDFVLGQNYPNPFNPSTVIRYGLPHKSQVSLMVYNTLGQMVSELANGEQEAGYHEVRFDASGLSSGVYFYRLQAGTYVQTRKLLIIR